MKKRIDSELKCLQGKLTRREFIARLSALGLSAAAAPALLGSSVQAATPKKGGRFRMGMAGGNVSDSMDPIALVDAMNQNINYQIRNCLVEVDHTGTPIPELAESWEPTPDATEWRFKLRKGVEFHNDKTLSTEDVIDSINYHRDETSKSTVKTLLAQIQEIKAEGKDIIVFTLQGGNADFPAILSDYHLCIFPAGTRGDDFEKGIGTGPYLLKKWEPGVRAFGVRNPNYWKDGRAHFDEVDTIGIPDVNARVNALQSGQIDYMNQVEVKTARLLKKKPTLKVLQISGKFHYTLPMMANQAPYDNLDVRLALKYAIDREALLKIVLNGFGMVGNDHPIAPNYRYYASDLPQRRYDPEKAKFHLKKAGLEGHTFKLHTTDLNRMIDLVVLYNEQAAKAGLKIEVVREPGDGYWSNVWIKKPWTSCFWNGRPTEDLIFSTGYAAGAQWNDTRWNNKRFNELLLAARAELDDNKRREMYTEMQRLCRDDGGTIIPLFRDYVEAASQKVQQGPMSGNLEADGCRNAERWWFES